MKYFPFLPLVLAALFLTATTVRAVLPPSARLQLYENGVPVKDSSVLIEAGGRYYVSMDGQVSVITQEAYPIFYKSQGNVLDNTEWADQWYMSHPGCEGFVTQKEELARASSDWEQSDAYRATQDKLTNDREYNRKQWDALKPAKIAFYKSRGLGFYFDPKCYVPYDDYVSVYVAGIKKDALYSVALAIPTHWINSDGNTVNVDLKRRTVTKPLNLTPYLMPLDTFFQRIRNSVVNAVMSVTGHRVTAPETPGW